MEYELTQRIDRHCDAHVLVRAISREFCVHAEVIPVGRISLSESGDCFAVRASVGNRQMSRAVFNFMRGFAAAVNPID